VESRGASTNSPGDSDGDRNGKSLAQRPGSRRNA
jgi:hypothetical protein